MNYERNAREIAQEKIKRKITDKDGLQNLWEMKEVQLEKQKKKR